MFNDKYGLTKAVLEGRKTMTRRVVPECKELDVLRHWEHNKGAIPTGYEEHTHSFRFDYCPDQKRRISIDHLNLIPSYKVGEVVAVAQRYSDMNRRTFQTFVCENGVWKKIENSAGWKNKMFVRADLMPHQIRITNVRVERMQDITDEDCLLEGIDKVYYGDEVWFKAYDKKDACVCAKRPKGAFAALIDKVSGNGTWESNPWVFVYEFELVK